MPYIDENKASEANIPVPTLRTKRIRGPPFYKFGRSVRYDLDELLAWAKARRALNTTDADRVEARLRAEKAGGAETPPTRFAAQEE